MGSIMRGMQTFRTHRGQARRILVGLGATGITPEQAVNRAITLHLLKVHPGKATHPGWSIFLDIDGMLALHGELHQTDLSVDHVHQGGEVRLEVDTSSFSVPVDIADDVDQVMETGRSRMEDSDW